MAEDKNLNNAAEPEDEDTEEIEIYTLTDEEGNESNFELLSEAEIDGVLYCALTELDDENEPIGDDYVILRAEEEDGEQIFVSIDDDDEFDRVADFFDDQFADIDYDEE